MSAGETIAGICGFLLLFFLILCTVNYVQILGAIKECNNEFGQGSWAFNITNPWYDNYRISCKAFYETSYKSSYETIYETSYANKTCYLNNVLVNCT